MNSIEANKASQSEIKLSQVHQRLLDWCLAQPSSPIGFDCRKGRCGACLVRVEEGAQVSPPTQAELNYFKGHRIEDKALRLGCQLNIEGYAVLTPVHTARSRQGVKNKIVVDRPIPQIGFSTNVLDNPPDVVGSVDKLSQLFDAIELELGERAEMALATASSAEYDLIIQKMRELRQKRSFYLSIHAPYLQHNLASHDLSEQKKSIDRLLWAMRVAKDFGCDKVTFHPGYSQGRSAEDTLDPLYFALDQIMPYAEFFKIDLCMENMGNERPDYIVYSAKQQEELCRKTGIKVALDIVHLASVTEQGPQFEDELSALAPFVFNIHMADMNMPRHIHLPIGEGNLPMVSILSTLWNSGYRGPAIVEEFGGPYQTQTFIDQAVQLKKTRDAAVMHG